MVAAPARVGLTGAHRTGPGERKTPVQRGRPLSGWDACPNAGTNAGTSTPRRTRRSVTAPPTTPRPFPRPRRSSSWRPPTTTPAPSSTPRSGALRHRLRGHHVRVPMPRRSWTACGTGSGTSRSPVVLRTEGPPRPGLPAARRSIHPPPSAWCVLRVGQLRQPGAGLPRHRRGAPRELPHPPRAAPRRGVPRRRRRPPPRRHWAQGESGVRGGAGHRPPRRAHAHAAGRLRAQLHPHPGFYEADEESSRRILHGLGIDEPEFPVLDLQFTSPPRTLQNPSDTDLVEAFRADHGEPTPASSGTRSSSGRGPGGARRGGGAEGLSTLVVEREAIGGQAGTSR